MPSKDKLITEVINKKIKVDQLRMIHFKIRSIREIHWDHLKRWFRSQVVQQNLLISINIQYSIIICTTTKKNTIERNSKLYHVNFWNWKQMLVAVILKHLSGFVDIIIKECKAGRGFTLSITHHSSQTYKCQMKTSQNLIKGSLSDHLSS